MDKLITTAAINGGVTDRSKNPNLPYTPEEIADLHFAESIPRDSVWSALAIGRSQPPINLHTLLLGDHVRTALEDNVYSARGELAASNEQLVARVVDIARVVGRDIASPAEARAILRL